MPYAFPGLTPFVEKAADDLGLACREQLHRAKSGWHLKTVVDALGQLPEMAAKAKAGLIDPKSTADAMDRIKLVRQGLAVQLKAIDDAIAEVVDELDLEPKPEPKKAAAKK